MAYIDLKEETGLAWNEGLIENARGAFDFFILHPYRLGLPLTSHPFEMAKNLKQVLHTIQDTVPDIPVAITEYGFLYDGDTVRNALLTADMTRMAIDSKLLMLIRHLLIEDSNSDWFATNATLIGGVKTPAYDVLKYFAKYLYQNP